MSTRFPRFFRFAALLTAFLLALSWAEVMMADVHDGDAEGRSPVAASAAGDEVPPPAPDPGAHDPLSPHTCHCIHVHLAGLPAGAAEPSWALAPLPLSFPAARALHSVAPEPHFRPPVL